jgi:hypothetical protein
MALVQNAVGNKLYVWSNREGRPSADTTECLISAHGGQSIINSRFDVRAVKLVFYCPHGFSLSDPGLDAVVSGTIKVNQTVESGQCQDYELSKYQGADNNNAGETYTKIRGLADTLAQQAETTRETALKMCDMAIAANGKAKQKLDAIAEREHKRYLQLGRWMDIVTVRKQDFWRQWSNPMLSDVIKVLHSAGYDYTTFHCVFCRSPQLNPFTDRGSYVAQKV